MKYFVSLILIGISANLLAQEKDTVSASRQGQIKIMPADSRFAKKDTVSTGKRTAAKADTSNTGKKYDVDAVVFASSSDSLVFEVKKRKMDLYNQGELKYKDTDLKSGKIFVNYETNQLEAFGIADVSDTAKVKLKQTPKLAEGKDNYEGTWIRYNFKNQSGYISLAKNKEQGQRYEGEKVRKMDKNTYFIENGMFTTCEKDTPDFYFSASEMKVIQKDKIIARWIFMYIGGVPFPIPLPFAVFPNENGRRSGIIIPAYGLDQLRGQYFRNFGYFWAASDYIDATLTGDFYAKGGYGLHTRFRYAERYDFSGALTASYSKVTLGEVSDPSRSQSADYDFSWYHNQQIDPTMRYDMNLQFMSSNYFGNNSISYNDLLSQSIISNATFSKHWDESGSSLTINYSRTQNLKNVSTNSTSTEGDIYEVLPRVDFSKSITYPFKRDDAGSLNDQKWYELIGYTYSGQFVNDRNKVDGNLDVRGGFEHDISVNAAPKVGYFTLSPSINYTEKWYNKRTVLVDMQHDVVNATGVKSTVDSVVTTSKNDLNFVRTFNLGVTASTRMYGVFNPNLLGIESFRHTLMPSISYSYSPNFSKDSWGYYDSYKTATGQVVRYDKFTGEVFGGVPGYESQQLNLSVGNVFEIKLAKSPSDTTKEQKKIQLLNLNASLGYNFAADSIKLSSLNLSYRTQVGDLLSLQGSSNYTFYDFKNGIQVNQFLASAGKGLFRLTSFNFSASTTLSGEKIISDEKKTPESKEKEEGFNAFQKKDYIALYDDTKSPDMTIPWNLSLSYNFNYSKPTPDESSTYSNISADLGFSLTKYWKFTVRGSYDIDHKQISAPQITIFRDLHCWEMNFVWNPLGMYSGFHLEIRIKAPELQDIKVTKSGGLYTGKR